MEACGTYQEELMKNNTELTNDKQVDHLAIAFTYIPYIVCTGVRESFGPVQV